MKTTISLCLLLLTSLLAYGQTGDLTYFEIKQMGDISKEKRVKPDLLRECAQAYFYNSEYKTAYLYYERLFKDSVKLENSDYFGYAQCLKVMGNYQKSEQMLTIYGDLEGKKYVPYGEEYEKDIDEQSDRYTTMRAEFNSDGSEYPLAVDGDIFYFLSNRKGGKYDERLDRGTYDLWESTITKDGRVSDWNRVSEVNESLNEGGLTISSDKKTAYFTQNDRKSYQLKIMRGVMVDDKWELVGPVHFNSTEYSVSQPVLSPDGKKLYFVSNMPGGYGETDIYVVRVLGDGSLGQPKNLGPKVNTLGRENFPFVTKEGDLYFSSTGHNTLGGFDVFFSQFLNKEKGFDEPVNIGMPVNSPADDFAYVKRDRERGYFSSNRVGGDGGDDIYLFYEHTPMRIRGSQRFGEIDVLSSSEYKANDSILPGSFYLIPKDEKKWNELKASLEELEVTGEGEYESSNNLEEGDYYLLPKNALGDTEGMYFEKAHINPDGTFDSDAPIRLGEYYVVPTRAEGSPLEKNSANLINDKEYASDQPLERGGYFAIPREADVLVEPELVAETANFNKNGTYRTNSPVETGKYHLVPKEDKALSGQKAINVLDDDRYTSEIPIEDGDYYLIPSEGLMPSYAGKNSQPVKLLEDGSYLANTPLAKGEYYLVPKNDRMLNRSGLSKGEALVNSDGTFFSDQEIPTGDYYLLPAEGEEIGTADIIANAYGVEPGGKLSDDNTIPAGDYFVVPKSFNKKELKSREIDINEDGSYLTNSPIEKGVYHLIPKDADLASRVRPNSTLTFSDDGSYESDGIVPEGTYLLLPKYAEYLEDKSIDLDAISVGNDGKYTSSDRILPGDYFFIPREEILNRNEAQITEVKDIKNIYFDLNSSFLRKDATIELELLLDVLTQDKSSKVQMTGHADQRGSAKYNMWLSERRAVQTADYLMKNGIVKERIFWKAEGESKPAVDCPNMDCDDDVYASSRRVEFVLFE